MLKNKIYQREIQLFFEWAGTLTLFDEPSSGPHWSSELMESGAWPLLHQLRFELSAAIAVAGLTVVSSKYHSCPVTARSATSGGLRPVDGDGTFDSQAASGVWCSRLRLGG